MPTPPPAMNQPFGSPPPRKSSTRLYVGIGAALLIGVLFILGVVVAAVNVAAKRAHDKEALAQFQKEANALKNTIDTDADLTDPATAKKADEVIERMSNAAGNLDQRMKSVVKSIMEEMVAIGKEASAITGRVVAAGGIDPATLTSKEVATKRIELLETEQRAAQANYQRTKNLSLTARAAALKSGMSSSDADSLVRGMNSKGQIDRITRIREIDTLLFQSFVSTVTLLRDNFGAWSIEDDAVAFKDAPAGVSERYEALSKEIGELSQEQNDIIEQINQSRNP